MNMNFIVWLIGIVAGIALAVIVLRFNIQKWVIIIATGILGAGTILGSFILMFNPGAQVLENPVQAVLKSSPLLMILFLVVAVVGIIGQFKASSLYKVESYNRWESPETTM